MVSPLALVIVSPTSNIFVVGAEKRTVGFVLANPVPESTRVNALTFPLLLSIVAVI